MRDGGTTVLIGQPAMGVKAGFDVYDATQFEHTMLGIEPGRREPGAARSRAGAAGRVAGGSSSSRWSPTGCRSTQINEAIEITASGAGGRVVIEL